MSKRRVLLIDDEESFTMLLKMNLEAIGDYSVEVVNDSTKALEVALEFRPNIILCDVVMPGADGGDVARVLRANPVLAKVPLIFFTALVSNKEGQGGISHSGGERFIAKPVSTKVLLGVLDDILGGA